METSFITARRWVLAIVAACALVVASLAVAVSFDAPGAGAATVARGGIDQAPPIYDGPETVGSTCGDASNSC